MAIDWAALKTAIVNASVIAINAELHKGADRARKDAPVRQIFKGGRQTVRFKTAEEIEGDRELRSRLGLAPEILATPEAIAKVQAAGINPIRRTRIKGTEYGFATTVQFPSRSRTRDRSGRTPAERGITRNARNRQNTFRPPFTPDDGYNPRIVEADREGKPLEPFHLKDEGAERQLSGRGRYELRTGRAIFQRQVTVRTAAIITGRGQLVGYETARVGTGPNYLGGALRDSIRVEPASAQTYPVIEGWVVAGGGEVDYAKYQELGTRHNPAHPFLRPRLPEWRQSFPDALRRSFGRAVSYRVVRG